MFLINHIIATSFRLHYYCHLLAFHNSILDWKLTDWQNLLFQLFHFSLDNICWVECQVLEGLACVLGGSLGHSQCHFPGDCASKVFLQIVSSGKGQELAPILGEADRLIQRPWGRGEEQCQFHALWTVRVTQWGTACCFGSCVLRSSRFMLVTGMQRIPELVPCAERVRESVFASLEFCMLGSWVSLRLFAGCKDSTSCTSLTYLKWN